MKLNKIKNTTARILASAALALALGLPGCYAGDAEGAGTGVWKFGSEIDALPYASNGYYGSAFAGRDGWRFRGIVARSASPSFLVTDGFKEKRTDAYAFVVDRFLGSQSPELKGFWIGGGVEYWHNRIRTEESPTYAYYNNFMLTAGCGYVRKLSRHFYFNSWVGGHLVAAGARNIGVSGKMYEQPVFTPEASVKFGFTL